MDIRLLDGAKKDLRDDWFVDERQSPGLGNRFLDAIEAEVQTLTLYASIDLKVEGFYRMLIRRFPFALYYLIDDDTIAIDAILDCRHDPSGLRKRLGGSEDLT